MRSYETSFPATAKRTRARLAPLGTPGGDSILQEVLFETYRPVLQRRMCPGEARTTIARQSFKGELDQSLDEALVRVLSTHYKQYLEESLDRVPLRPATARPAGPDTKSSQGHPGPIHLAPPPQSSSTLRVSSADSRSPRSTAGLASASANFAQWPAEIPQRAIIGLARSMIELIADSPPREQAFLLGVLIDRIDPQSAGAALGIPDPGLATYEVLRTVAMNVCRLPADSLSGLASAVRRQGAPLPDRFLQEPIVIPQPPAAPPPSSPPPLQSLGPLAFDPGAFAWQRVLAQLSVTLAALARGEWPSRAPTAGPTSAAGLSALACLLAQVFGPLSRAVPHSSDAVRGERKRSTRQAPPPPSRPPAPASRRAAGAPADSAEKAAPVLHKRIRRLLGL